MIMTYAAKNKSRGTAFKIGSGGAFTALGGLQSIDVSGEKSETEDTTTLDGGQYKTKDPTGLSDPPVIKFSGFYDPVNAGWAALQGLVAAPVPTACTVTYTDTAATVATYEGTGFGIDKKVDVTKPLMASGEVVTSGAPT